MCIWLTARKIEIESGEKCEFEAVRHLLNKVVQQTEEKPGLMPSLISFLVKMKMPPYMSELSEAEIRLLFPSQEEIGAKTPDMYHIFYLVCLRRLWTGSLKKNLQLKGVEKYYLQCFMGRF